MASENELDNLKAEVVKLRKFKSDVDRIRTLKSKVSAHLVRVWVGPDLNKSFGDWLASQKQSDSSENVSTTANLLAAIVRRVVKVGFVVCLLALLPTLLLFWQNLIMKTQNQSLITQIEAQRDASSSQQVTEYIKLLLSDDQKQSMAGQSFLVSDLVNRDLSVERLSSLVTSGQNPVQCPALNALNRILAKDSLNHEPNDVSAVMTLKDALAPKSPNRAYLGDLNCDGIDFSDVPMGGVAFIFSKLPNANFNSTDLADVWFDDSVVTHSDFSAAFLCDENGRCAEFIKTDLSHSKFELSHVNKNIISLSNTLTATQLNFSTDLHEMTKNILEEVKNSGFEIADNSRFKMASIEELETAQKYEFAKSVRASLTVLKSRGELSTVKAYKGNATPPGLIPKYMIEDGICSPALISLACYQFHVGLDLEHPDLRQPKNCPLALVGPIVSSDVSTCKELGFID